MTAINLHSREERNAVFAVMAVQNTGFRYALAAVYAVCVTGNIDESLPAAGAGDDGSAQPCERKLPVVVRHARSFARHCLLCERFNEFAADEFRIHCPEAYCI